MLTKNFAKTCCAEIFFFNLLLLQSINLKVSLIKLGELFIINDTHMFLSHQIIILPKSMKNQFQLEVAETLLTLDRLIMLISTRPADLTQSTRQTTNSYGLEKMLISLLILECRAILLAPIILT